MPSQILSRGLWFCQWPVANCQCHFTLNFSRVRMRATIFLILLLANFCIAQDHGHEHACCSPDDCQREELAHQNSWIEKTLPNFKHLFEYIFGGSSPMPPGDTTFNNESVAVPGDILMMGSNCPHPEFSRKHHCEHCKNDQDALAFSKERRATGYPTNVNSVLMGNADFVSEDHNGEPCCKNAKPAPVTKCNIKGGYCRSEGQQCTTWHATRNGHLFYEDNAC